jgi:drug/metabolite transporter (DMT)-like permease
VNPAYLVAALGSVLYGGADFCGGLAARRSAALVVTFASGLSALLVLVLGLALAHGVPSAADLAWGATAGAVGVFGAALIYRAIALGPVSVASPVLCVVGLSVPVLVGLALGERPGTLALGGVGLAVLAIPLLARAHTDGHPDGPEAVRRVLPVALAAGLTAGLFLVCVGRIGRGAGLWPLLLARGVAVSLLLAWLTLRRQPLWPMRGSRSTALVAGAFDSAANVAYLLAVQRGSLALVATLVSLSPATTVLLARLFLGERWTLPQRWGLVLALVAAVCISAP